MTIPVASAVTICWTPLRGEPCFEQIVASVVPKGNS
jgi:hypothetical protein